ncbi:MAG TPA: cytochrome P450 [Myxococcales bacterium]|nr:cytochrome P450 [Myxococcales bacterium]HIM02229.1 cytochrome P450 [Myxococcales bacterium]
MTASTTISSSPPPKASTQPSASDFDLLSPDVRENPYPYYAAMRRESPIHPLAPGAPLYAITRHADVIHILHHPEQFSSSALQAALQGGASGLGPNSGALAGHRLLASPMMIATDPPDHGRLRRLVNRGFTPRRIAALEPRMREIANQCLDDSIRDGQLELVRGLSIPLPVKVIAEMLGVERDRVDQFKAWSDAFVIGLSGADGQYTPEDVRKAADEMADYFERFAAERRAAPKDDLISVLTQAEEGDALSTGELISFVALLLIAGNETTTNLIGNGVKALLAHPNQLERVMADASLIPSLVDEVLRYDSPIQALPRSNKEAVELPSGLVPENSTLLVFYAAANHDDEQFPNAEKFDIDRSTQEHVAFSHGIHYCLGASLARLEARVAFETLFSRCTNIKLAAESISMLDSAVLRGPKSVPLYVETT